MNAGLILQIILVAAGVLIVCITLISLAKSRMTEPFCLMWGLFAIVLMLAGIMLRPVGWVEYVSPIGLILILIMMTGGIHFLYFVTCRVSELVRKVNELAISVSLLHTEREELQAEIACLKKQLSDKADADTRNDATK